MRCWTFLLVFLSLVTSVAWSAETGDPGLSSLVVTRTPDCAALVFEKFCLGESHEALTTRHKPRKTFKNRKHGETSLLYEGERGSSFVDIRDDRVVFIRMLINDASWEYYDRILATFEGKLGPGQDHSQFPDYAKDAKDRESALRAGSAVRRHSWKGEGWLAVLHWQLVGGRHEEISLSYEFKE